MDNNADCLSRRSRDPTILDIQLVAFTLKDYQVTPLKVVARAHALWQCNLVLVGYDGRSQDLFFRHALHVRKFGTYIRKTKEFWDLLKSKAKDIDRYTHGNKKRANNPPVGLVTARRDPDRPSKTYAFDQRTDPQLQWSGKLESAELEIDTVSLHVHERIDPSTILEKAISPDRHAQQTMHGFFEDDENNPPYRDAIDFYGHGHNWSNRLVAGDSLLVMNSLLEKEGMRGRIQMIYVDPPYGIKYGSNFQPFVNKRDVVDGKDEDLTQEPEMIKAFRDTWELGIHSYLSYMRDRLLLSRELLHESGSCIVQISIENVARVRIIMDEIFGADNFVSMITVQKTTSSTSKTLDSVADYLCWYAKNKKNMKYKSLYAKKDPPRNDTGYKYVELKNGNRRSMTLEERHDPTKIPKYARIYMQGVLTSAGNTSDDDKFKFQGKTYTSGLNHHWKTTISGMQALASKNRIVQTGSGLAYVRYFDDFPYRHLDNIWTDATSGFLKKRYVVQTNSKIIERIMLMTTDPGDLVLDPTCGSGTTAYAAEKLGRRWITCDTSRVALIIAKQRIMSSKFDYYKLSHPDQGVVGGFEYEGVKHPTLKTIASGESAPEETLYDRPVIDKNKIRVTGPFTIEAVPAPLVRSIDALYHEVQNSGDPEQQGNDSNQHQQQWRDELRRAGIRGKDGQKIEFARISTHPTTRHIHADAETNEENPKRAVVSFGPKYAPLEQRQVEMAMEEAHSLVPKPKMVIFAAMQFDPEASKDIDQLKWPDGTVLKVEVNKDLLTADLKKNRATNESFWLMGQPDVELERAKGGKYAIRVNGFDYYNTSTDEIESGGPSKIAMWMLDTDYDGRSLYPQQVFFPMEGKAGGWNSLAKALHSQIDEELIAKYRGIESIPFESGPNKRAAVKIIDDRGIESLKIIELE